MSRDPTPASNLLLLPLVTAAFAFASSALHTIAIPAQYGFTLPTGDIDFPALLYSSKETLEKFNGVSERLPSTSPFDAISRIAVTSEPLSDCVLREIDARFLGNITLGSAGREEVSMTFDTGSANIVIPANACKASQGCSLQATSARPNALSSETISLAYTGGIRGNASAYSDTVTLAGLTVANQSIIRLSESTGLGSNGIFGMLPSYYSQTNAPTWFENLILQKKIDDTEFSFYLGRASSGTGNDSELTVGGRNSSKFTGLVIQVPVANRTAWIVPVDGVLVSNALAGEHTRGHAIVDTGSSVILTSVKNAVSIFSHIPGSFPVPVKSNGAAGSALERSYFFAYPCNTTTEYLPALRFGNASLPIDPRDFSLGKISAPNSATAQGVCNLASGTSQPPATSSSAPGGQGGLCLAAIQGVDLSHENYPDGTLYVLGDAFLKGWYSIFEYGKDILPASVSFAKAI